MSSRYGAKAKYKFGGDLDRLGENGSHFHATHRGVSTLKIFVGTTRSSFDKTLYCVVAAPATTVDAVSADQLNGRSRRRNVHDDALLKNRLETVIKNATLSWPNKQKRPPISAMVKELIRQDKAQGYDGETLRKILSGTYEPAKRLGISPDW